MTEIATLLAKEAVARRVLQKEALDLPQGVRDFGTQAAGWGRDAMGTLNDLAGQAGDYASQAGEWLTEPGQQGWRQGLAGAGVGGLLGLGSSMFRDKEERQPFRSALTGALAGGALGGGAGLLQQHGPAVFGGGEADDPDLAETNKEIADIDKKLDKGAPKWWTDADSEMFGFGGDDDGGDGGSGATPDELRDMDTNKEHGVPMKSLPAMAGGGLLAAGAMNQAHGPAMGAGARAIDASRLGEYENAAHPGGRSTVEQLRTGASGMPTTKAMWHTRYKPALGTPPIISGAAGGPTISAPRRWHDYIPRLKRPDLGAQNPHMPGLTNAQVRALGKYKPRGFRAGLPAVVMSLPLIMNYLTAKGLSNEHAKQVAMDTLAKAKGG